MWMDIRKDKQEECFVGFVVVTRTLGNFEQSIVGDTEFCGTLKSIEGPSQRYNEMREGK